MSRVITFSRFFPATHPRKGEPTYFVEKILNAIAEKTPGNGLVDRDKLSRDVLDIVNDFFLLCSNNEMKHHTIRTGNRWKVGDKFSPRVWSGKPYASKQITIAPDIEIKKIWGFKITDYGYWIDDNIQEYNQLKNIAKNDGLSLEDFECWFSGKKIADNGFTGQIISWSQDIEY